MACGSDRIRQKLILGGILIFFTFFSAAHSEIEADSLKSATAFRVNNGIHIDGNPVESDWDRAEELSGFRQYEPDEGEPCSQKTLGKVLYDDEAVYLAFWCYDDEPDKIIPILTRRDRWSESDFISVRIDSHHDHQTAYYFNVNAAGVMRDILLYNNTYADESWDAVWEANAKVHDWGWTAEFKIPYSALRFTRADKYTWGLQIGRYIGRDQEDARWQFTPDSETRGVARYGHLEGIEGIEPPARLEVMPYVVGTGIDEPETQGNPDGRKSFSDFGLDFKYGISSAFTLNATINPDFGQVESDETVLNLTTYETFFPEKRPFFLEGIDLFQSLYFDQFYSRRIGRAPRGSVDTEEDYYYLDYPRATSILGAFKLTGKTNSGTAIGVLNATTQEEKAKYTLEGIDGSHEAVVEPLANYTVFRVKQDVFDKSYIGGMLTAVGQDHTQSSYAASGEFSIYLPDDRFKVDGQAIGTRNGRGTDDYAFMGEFSKESGKNIRGNILYDYYGINADWNRLGFISEVGYWGTSTWWQIRSNKEVGFIRYANANINGWYNEYSDGLKYSNGGNINGNLNFTNNYHLWYGVGYNGDRYDKRETRGNGHWLKEYGISYWFGGETNHSKPLSFWADFDYTEIREGSSTYYEAGTVYRPRQNLELKLGLEYTDANANLYWIGTGEDNAAVFRKLNNDVFDITFRSTYTFARNLTLQWYSQMYFSSGEYGDEYYRMIDSDNLERVNPAGYAVEEERGNFNYKALSINLILRWEFRPGSTFYLVWTQARDGYDSGDPEQNYRFNLSRDFDDMFTLPQTNTLLAKIHYWWNI